MSKILFGATTPTKNSGSDNLFAQANLVAESAGAGIRKAQLFMEAEGANEEGVNAIIEGKASEEGEAAAEVLTDSPITIETADVVEVGADVPTPGETEVGNTIDISEAEEIHAAADQLVSEIHEEAINSVEPALSGDTTVATGEAEVDASSETEVAADVDNTGSGTAGETVQTGEDAAAVGDIKVEVNL
jgi:hypothetical protein